MFQKCPKNIPKCQTSIKNMLKILEKVAEKTTERPECKCIKTSKIVLKPLKKQYVYKALRSYASSR